jgi:predicted SAM-dependent methyltransferase
MKRFLNLGSGKCHIRQDGVEWINIDKEQSHQPDVVMDYLELDLADSVDGIISLHSIEHLSWPEGVTKFFSVAHKILKPGGTLRLVVPDLMKVAKLYVEGDDLKGVYGPDFKVTGPDCAATRFMAFARGWEHTVLFDERLLRMLAEQAGFVGFRVMQFGCSDVPELRHLDRFASESGSFEMDKP